MHPASFPNWVAIIHSYKKESNLNTIALGEEIDFWLKTQSFMLSHLTASKKKKQNTIFFVSPLTKKLLKSLTLFGIASQFRLFLITYHMSDSHFHLYYTADRFHYLSIFSSSSCLHCALYPGTPTTHNFLVLREVWNATSPPFLHLSTIPEKAHCLYKEVVNWSFAVRIHLIQSGSLVN
jgi:hypothetical protein